MKKKIAATLGIIGFTLLLGTFGSLDVNSITISQGIFQSVVGLACFSVACLMCRYETF